MNNVRKLIRHAGVKKTAAVVIFQKLQGGVDLAAAHENARGITVQFKADFQELVLDRVSVEENQRFLCHILNGYLLFFCQPVLVADAEDNLVIC